MCELLPADALDHKDVGGRAMSGTIAEIELIVWDGLDDFLYRALVEIPLPFGWTTGRGDRRWPTRLTDMDQNAFNRLTVYR